MKRLIIWGVFCTLIYAGSSAAQDNPDVIIFSHRFHVEEAGSGCLDCHGEAATSLLPSDNLLPPMETCYTCHDQDESECGMCHTNPDEPGIAQRVTGYRSRFPHKLHVGDGENCLVCHSGVEKKEAVGSLHLPDNGSCASCHLRADYSEERQKCLVCHEDAILVLPADHRLNWNKDHGLQAQMKRTSCVHCHQEHFCIACHEGDNLDHQVHPLNFKYSHGILVKANKENCLTCHQEQAFCLDCHQIEMVMPRNHSYTNWSNKSTGGRHALEAKYDFDTCLSCHNDAYTDVVCVTCHGK